MAKKRSAPRVPTWTSRAREGGSRVFDREGRPIDVDSTEEQKESGDASND